METRNKVCHNVAKANPEEETTMKNVLLMTKMGKQDKYSVGLATRVDGGKIRTKTYVFNSKGGDVISELQAILVGMTRVKEDTRGTVNLFIKTRNKYIYRVISNIEKGAACDFKTGGGRSFVGFSYFRKIHALAAGFKSVTITKY